MRAAMESDESIRDRSPVVFLLLRFLYCIYLRGIKNEKRLNIDGMLFIKISISY